MSGFWIGDTCKLGRGIRVLAIFAAIFVFFAPGAAAQAPWITVGPPGGDARSFAAVPGEPNHLYLGTTNSWIYESVNGGASWHRLAKLDSSDGLIVDHILVEAAHPATMYAAAWKADSADGGLWVSQNAGRSWSQEPGLRGQSIRAFAQAPSDPRILYAGTLEGVFRSGDAGQTWTLISPMGSREIHEIESLAVDPVDPNVVYAGTWHLPWKTLNAGKSWRSIKQGLIVDSDVFSIVVDSDRPRTVYLSACSGIYKSESAGLQFRKIQGIPSAARRTRVLKQDPANHEIVYAGTTEGLYKTVNGGKTFRRMTGSDVIVNDVHVDPLDPRHVLLATDRGGVLTSSDGGVTFAASNAGFSQRKVVALLVDRRNPKRLYAGVVNDKTFGGVFVSTDGGANWEQTGAGLDGRDVFALAQAKDGTVLAGTNRGIFALDSGSQDAHSGKVDDPPPGDPAGAAAWTPMNAIANTVMKTVTRKVYGTRVNVEKQMKAPVVEMDSRVNALDLSSDIWLAATDVGMYTSRDHGATWQGGPVLGAVGYQSIAVHKGTIVASRPDGVAESTDGGLTWMPLSTPRMLTRIHRVTFSPEGTLWLGAREGVYFTRDKGKTWMWIERLPFRDVDDLYYDAALGKVLVSSRTSDQVYAIDPKTLKWKWWQTGYRIALIRGAGDRLVAASLDDGVLQEPWAAGTETAIGEPGHRTSVSSDYER